MNDQAITITMTVGEELADPDDATGLTARAYDDLFGILAQYGYDIDIKRGEQ